MLFNENKHLISVIIPVYNKSRVVKKTILSVLGQSFNEFELIIVDDGSTDNSLEIIKNIKDERIRLLKKENGGVSDARNFGIKKAKGNWIFLLDADDILYENGLQVLFNLTKKYKEKSIYVANFSISSNDKIKLYCKENKENIYSKCSRYIWHNKIFTRTGNTLIKKDVFKKIGYYRTDITYFEDMEFILRYSEVYDFVYTPVPVFIYETDNNALSKNKRALENEFAYHATFENYSFYAKLIIGKIIYYSIRDRVKIKDKNSLNYLISRYYRNFIFIGFSIIYSKIKRVDR